MSLTDMSVKRFVNEVSADSPIPGGGSISALAAALAAALVSMVGSLSLRKLALERERPGAGASPTMKSEGHRGACPEVDPEADMAAAVDIARDLMRRCVELVSEDADAYSEVMRAYRLPRSTPAEKQVRADRIQEALKEACRVPAEVAKGAVEALRLSELVAREGLQSALSDAAVACLAADAALHGACFNIKINLGSVKDAAFASEMRQDMARALSSGQAIRKRVMSLVEEAFE